MRSFKKGLLRQHRIVSEIENLRHLVSVRAVPNEGGGCNTITVSFQYAGWTLGDVPEQFIWTGANIGDEFFINACIDLNTLTYNCIGRIVFTWDDGITC
jgi:hypothetical protein